MNIELFIQTKSGKAPCAECKNRAEGCHATCEAYILWRKARDDEVDEIHMKRDIEKASNRISDRGDFRMNGTHGRRK